jgi:hypothetical protein
VNGPVLGESYGKNHSDSSRLDDWTESLIVIDARSLSESSKYPTSFVSTQGAIGEQFVSKDPFSSDHIDARRASDKAPGVIGEERIIFSLHSGAPIGI